MKRIATVLALVCASGCWMGAYAQQTPKVNQLLKIKDGDYFANRDTANLDPYYALRKLVLGNKRFFEEKSIRPRQSNEFLKDAGNGQKPFATIVGCSDSRVPNEIIFDQGVGDLFIVRTAGQVMAEASYGTIEYSTEVLKTKLIVVLGHESCGAVDAAIKLPENPPGHVVTLINAIKPAAVKSFGKTINPKDRLALAIRENVLQQVNELRELEPVLSKRFQKGEVLIVGAVYDIDSGRVEFLEETISSLPRFAAVARK
ncbi:MAG: carbonic anhydrase [Cyclobacteriaceae bacterium]|nr:carbonic anhydrase [Cyclobacteriaceae bacterium]